MQIILKACKYNIWNKVWLYWLHLIFCVSIFLFCLFFKIEINCVLLLGRLFFARLFLILNKSWRQHTTRHQLYGHLPPITKTIQVRRTRHTGHCWRSRDELISDVLLCTPTYGSAKDGRPARTYIRQLCEDTRCSPEDLPEVMSGREMWWERVRDIRVSGTTWWWWGFLILLLLLLIDHQIELNYFCHYPTLGKNNEI